MRLGIAGLLFVVPLALCSCDSWPPYQDKATENFLDHRDSLEALETKFSSSKYISVSIAAGDNAIGRLEVEGGLSREFIDDDPEWASLFKEAQVTQIIRRDKAFVFAPSAPHSKDGRETEISYTHFFTEEPELKECKPEFEDLRCGVCGVRIESKWWIDYMWYPYPILEAEHQKYLDNQLPDEEYFEMQDAAIRECRIEGLTAIGYEIE